MNSKDQILNKTAKYFKDKNIRLPKISELADPNLINKKIKKNLETLDKDSDDPLNLYRVHWHNNYNHSNFNNYPEHIILPSEFTGIEAKIIVNIGRLFPLIQAHKVLAAYACLLPKIVNGEFNYTNHKAVWPSTGNYCRGGVAISNILGCRSIAVLPEGMSDERFNWLNKWVLDPNDIIKTPGTESNVREIYDACKKLENEDSNNIIINQFSEFNNYAVHRTVTGPSLEKSFLFAKGETNLKAKAYVAASGSSGTLAAGDYLKNKLGISIAVVEPLECPTLFNNGYGEHNIQGIGDKHIPLIHNIMNNDYVITVSDKATDNLNLVFNTDIGKNYLIDQEGFSKEFVERLPEFGFSSIANIIASIKLAKFMNLGKDDAIITVATDGAELYLSELQKTKDEFKEIYDANACKNIFKQYMKNISTDNMVQLSDRDRERIFNLGYYTWVEQQNIELSDFEIRKNQSFWDKKTEDFLKNDLLIDKFNYMIES